MENPCKSCLVRAACTMLCKEWFCWASSKIPFEVDIPFSEFLEKVGAIGAIKNYYQKIYNVVLIRFERVGPTSVRVCLTVDNR